MANLTKNIGTVTLTGAAEKITLPAVYGWVWVKNMSEGDIFAGLSEDISEGADGVMTIPAGDCGRIQADSSREIYPMGTGNVQIIGQNYADCPFKSGAKGGGSSGSGQGLVLLKEEEMAFSSTSSYTFKVGNDFNIDDYAMLIFAARNFGTVIITPECEVAYFAGVGSAKHKFQWVRDDMFTFDRYSETTALNYFRYQLFGVKR